MHARFALRVATTISIIIVVMCHSLYPETCTNNAIRSPGAEEDDSVIASDWSIDFSIQQNPIPGNIFSTESGNVKLLS